MVHGYYQQRGGEDAVFDAESALLERGGHSVIRYTVRNDDANAIGRMQLATDATWNHSHYRALRGLIASTRPEVVHCHNSFPLISPAAPWAAFRSGVPFVQTLHNFRLLCANGLFYRNGRVCESCLGRLPLPGVLRRCYRDSAAATGALVLSIAAHRALGTYRRTVTRFIALTEFAKKKLVDGGLPKERIVVKSNFLDPDPGEGSHSERFALFVGRLSGEKGFATVRQIWGDGLTTIPLHIVGDGPLASQARELADSRPNVRWFGRRDADEVRDMMKRARLLLFPSECFEMAPMVLVEAMATGLPVVGTQLGAAASMIHHERTGLLAPVGDVWSFANHVRVLDSDNSLHRAMSVAARQEYVDRYTGRANLRRLVDIYAAAVSSKMNEATRRAVTGGA